MRVHDRDVHKPTISFLSERKRAVNGNSLTRKVERAISSRRRRRRRDAEFITQNVIELFPIDDIVASIAVAVIVRITLHIHLVSALLPPQQLANADTINHRDLS